MKLVLNELTPIAQILFVKLLFIIYFLFVYLLVKMYCWLSDLIFQRGNHKLTFSL